MAIKAKGTILVLLISLLLGLPAEAVEVPSSPRFQMVRVGFFAMEGYHEMDASGRKSGYGYDCLQRLSRYTDWVYSYEGYNKSAAEMENMLAAGEIDLLTPATKTAARLQRFEFSQHPIGYYCTMLTVRADDFRYTAKQYATYSGMRVGMVKDSACNDGMTAFAKQCGFSYKTRYFDTQSALVNALQEGDTIDAALTTNMRRLQDERVLEAFDQTPFYAIVKKGNHALLESLNAALIQIDSDRYTLSNGRGNDTQASYTDPSLAYTKEEAQFIQQCREEKAVFYALLSPDRNPYSSFKNGKPHGLHYDMASEIIRRTGLTVRTLETANCREYREQAENEAVSLWLDMYADASYAEENGYRMTEPYDAVDIVQLTRKNQDGEIRTVAAVRYADITVQYLRRSIYTERIVYYDTVAQCVEAVRSGKQDAFYLYSLAAQQILHDDVANQLMGTAIPGISASLVIGVHVTENPLLVSIFNKAVRSVNRDTLNSLADSYMIPEASRFSLIRYVYQYPFTAVLALAALFTLLLGIIWYRCRCRRRMLQQACVYEHERFIRYACRVNDEVREVDVPHAVQYCYQAVNGTIQRTKRPLSMDENWQESIHPDDRASAVKQWNKETTEAIAMQEGEPYLELRLHEPDDGYRWNALLLMALPPDAQHPCQYMLFRRNIDQQKRLQREKSRMMRDAFAAAEQANAAKNAFVSRVSHDIRQPLNAMIGDLTTAQSIARESVELTERLIRAEISAKRLLRVVNDALEEAPREKEHLPLMCLSMDLRKEIEMLASTFYMQAKQKQIDFRVILHEVTREKLRGDGRRLAQILDTLLTNAIQVTPAGGQVTLLIWQLACKNGMVYFRFEVADTGAGMTEEECARLLAPSESSVVAITDVKENGHLSLPAVKALVVMRDGCLQARSEAGRGTVFQVELLLAEDAETAEHEPPFGQYKDISALIVDRDEDVCTALCQSLQRYGVLCDTAMDSGQALQKIAGHGGYTVILMEWQASDAGSMTMAERIREAAQAQTPPARIAALSYDASDTAADAYEAGASYAMAKPVFDSALVELLKTLCRKDGNSLP